MKSQKIGRPCPKIKDFEKFFDAAKTQKFSTFRGFRAISGTQPKLSSLPTAPCFAVIASKKSVSRKAVFRNRVKRRLRAAGRLVLAQNSDFTDDIVLSGTFAGLQVPWLDLVSQVQVFCQTSFQNLESKRRSK